MEFPGEADVYLRTAKIQADNADYHGAFETIRTAKEKVPVIDTDWRYSTMLALGEVQPHMAEDLPEIELEPETRRIIQLLLVEYWPSFKRLSPRAQEAWIVGAFLSHVLSDKSMSTAMVSVGNTKFALAVEIELGEKVFSPVRDYFRERIELSELVRSELLEPRESKNSELLPFCEFIKFNPHINLGFCEKVLGFCKQRNAPIFVAVRGWVECRFPRLLPNADLLKGIRRFRNDTTHGNASTLEVDDLEAKCRTLIETLHEQSPVPPPA